MATFTVTTKTDENDAGASLAAPGGTGLSLREALALANANAGADTIIFSSTAFSGGAASLIRLTLGEIAITDAVTIDGSGATGLVITGDKNNDDVNLAGTELTNAFTSTAAQLADNSRIFIAGNTTVSISDMTLTGGRTTANSALGGAILSAGTLNLTDVTLTGNSTAGTSSFGTAVAAETLALENVTVAGNVSQSGVSVVGTNLTILNSTVTGNTGATLGGGVGGPSVSITNSIITGNTVDVFQTAGTTSYQGLNIIGFSSQTLPSGTVISPDAADVFAATTQLPSPLGSSVAGVLDTSGSRPCVPLKTSLLNQAIDASNNTAPTTDALGNTRADQPTVPNSNGSAADLGAVESGLIRTASATFTVTTANDELDSTKIGATLADMGGANDLSLREAIFLANQEGGSADIISFSSSVFTGGAANLIRLTLGEINITDAVTIDASGAGGITITGDKNNDDITEAGSEITDVTASLTGSDRLADNSRIFVIDDLSPTTLKALTITGGRTTASNNLSPLPLNNGGAIKSASDLTIIDSTIAGNSTKGGEAGGGAIYSGAKLTVDGSTVRDNLTSGQASGGAVMSVGAVTVSNSLFADNKTLNVTPSLLVSAGGAIAAVGQVEVTNSTFSGNSVAADGAGGGAIISAGNVILNGSTIEGNSVANSVGGGISSGASISATNSTISGNTTNGAFAPGAGLAAVGSVSLINSTVSGNATVGANSLGAGIFANGTITLTNSIVLGNDAAQASSDELFTGASVVANGLNIVGANQAAFDVTGHTGIVNANPASVFAHTVANGSATAGVLANNGGPVQTIALKVDATNPALDASNTSAPALDAAGHIRFDAPGVASPNGSIADLGAAEAAEFPSLVVTTNFDVVDAFDGKTSLREAVAFANGHAGADTITFDATVFTGGAASLIRLTSGLITITDAVTIDGSTATGVTITGDKNGNDTVVAGTNITDVAASGAALLADNSSIFFIFGSTSATTLDSLTLTGGRNSGAGGAIRADADLTLVDSTVSGNLTTNSNADGGGIAGNTVTLTNSTVSGNSTAGDDSRGGGIIGFTVTLTNSTVSGNSTAGVASHGGGIFGNNSVTLTNSIVLGNNGAQTTSDEIFGTVTANGLNIVGTGVDTNGSDGIINADPINVFAQTVDIDPGAGTVLAGVLANNGGNLPTIALKLDVTNPALDAASAAAPTTDTNGNPRFDQPGVTNVNGGFADLGAAEAGEFPSLVVTTLTDVVNAFDGQTSLREAIAYANSKAGADTITFDAGLTGVVRLTGGELILTETATIDGGERITISGDVAGNDILAAGFTNISDVVASQNAGTAGENVRIFNSAANLTVKNITLTGGMPGGQGGAIVASGDVTVLNSVIMGNAANDTSTGQASGGAILNGGDVIVTDSIISGNYSALGSPSSAGGIAAGNNAIITNSTISFNYGASQAGGIIANGSVTLLNSTVTGNVSSAGGGIVALGGLVSTNSIIVGNTAFQDLEFQSFVAAVFNGLNIVGTGNDTDASDGVINADPTKVFASTVSVSGFNTPIVQAGVLANNGGYVPTVALKLDVTNPALDASNASAPVLDARGFARQDLPQVGNNGSNFADLGAFEARDLPPTAVVLSNLTTLAENTSTAAHIKVADISVTDTDGGNNVLSLSGADASKFEIVGSSLFLKAGTVLDFETKSSYAVTVDADGPYGNPGAADASTAFTLNVTDVNEAPTAVNFSNVLASIAENSSTAARIKVADIGITDDALGSETITLAGADAAKFEVINGVLYIKAGTVLNFEADSSLDVTVNVDDPTVGGAIDVSRALSVAVTDVAETINGTAAAEVLNGGVGADRIFGLGGNDTINGGAGNDSIVGGAGADRLTGGAGADTFIFSSIAQSAYKVSGTAVEGGPLIDAGSSLRDVITDFTVGVDKIDVSLIDANENVAGNQAFAFRGTGNFAGTGSIVYRKFDNAGTANDHTVVYFDTTGDGRSDMLIALNGLKTLTVSDFIL